MTRHRPAAVGAAMLLSGVLASAGAAPGDPPDSARPPRADALGAVHDRLATGAWPDLHGVVVRQDGETLLEWYGQGPDETIGRPLGTVRFTASTLHDVRSVTKSVVGLLAGIAAADGALPDLDRPALAWFPEYRDLQTAERQAIRLRHLLTMTSGLLWDEWTWPYSDPRNSEIAMELADDPYRHTLAQPIVAAPGSRWGYSGGDVALVGAIVARATGERLDDYARTRLFAPLGIDDFEWSAREGVPRAASGLRLTPRAMATIGELVLNGGRAGGRQLVPADWIAASIREQVAVRSPVMPEGGYGQLWWLGRTTGGTPWVAGIGNGGQRIWLVPERGLVVAITAGAYNRPDQGAAPLAVLEAVLAALDPASP